VETRRAKTVRNRVLKLGLPPQRELFDAGESSYFPYDVSPNGVHIAWNAWQHSRGRLCLFSVGGGETCVPFQYYSGHVSVSDSGEVLTETTLEETCNFRDPWHASREPRPQYGGVDVCPAIAYWRPGKNSVEVVEPLATDPQWITPETAARLRDWSVGTDGGSKFSD